MAKWLNLLLFAFIHSVTFGQTADSTMRVSKSNIRFGIGIMHVRMIDQGYTDSRLLFRGTNTKFGLAYGREGLKHVFNVSFAGSIGSVESESGELPSKYYFAQASLQLLRNVREYKAFNTDNRFFLGAVVSSTNHGTANEHVIDNVSVFSLHGAYLSFRNQLYISEKKYFQISYSMPLMVYENRLLWNGGASEYTYRDSQNIPGLLTGQGKFSYFSVLRNIQTGIDYVILIGNGTSFIIAYKFFYAKSFVEAPINLYSNELMLELKIRL
jgi:hypothetical protein